MHVKKVVIGLLIGGCLIAGGVTLFSYGRASEGKTIYFVAPSWGNLFPADNGRDDGGLPIKKVRAFLQQKGLQVKQVDSLKNLTDVRYIICFDVPLENRSLLADLCTYGYKKRILFLWEPPSVKLFNYNKQYHIPFSKIFTWADDLVDNVRYCKLYIPQPHLVMIDEVPPAQQKKLCTMIAYNKGSRHPNELYTARREVISFFEQQKNREFDLYGHDWQSFAPHTYRGMVERKADTLKQYKFAFCYENICNINGYVSEKIFDAFVSGCVPIYWGAANVTSYIPADCFIDRRNFANTQALYDYLKAMPDTEYDAYLARIKIFLAGSQAQLFSIERFIHIFDELCG